MAGTLKTVGGRRIHIAFEISLALKGAFSLAEIGAGIFTWFATRRFLLDLALQPK